MAEAKRYKVDEVVNTNSIHCLRNGEDGQGEVTVEPCPSKRKKEDQSNWLVSIALQTIAIWFISYFFPCLLVAINQLGFKKVLSYVISTKRASTTYERYF